MDAEIVHPVILVRINQLYDPSMDGRELYDHVRGVWVVGERRNAAEFALGVYRGEILEAYSIDDWHPAGTTEYASRIIDRNKYANRWEFTGKIAPEEIRERYVGKSAAHCFVQGEANPVKYINC